LTREASDPPNDVDILQRSELATISHLVAQTLTSGMGRYCCKSRKSNNPENLAKVELWASLLLRRFSTPLRRSVIDFG
jgi:hypothetical protein